MKKQIRFEQLLGKRIYGVDGEVVGRIREANAEWRGHDCIVTELLVGKHLRVEASAIDWSDPLRPRLRR